MDNITYTHVEQETQEPASTLVTLGFLVGTPLASGGIIITVTYLIKWIGGLL